MRPTPGYEFIFRAGHHPLIIYDRDAVICDLNEVAARNFGASRAECIGRALSHFLPAIHEMGVERIASVLASGRPGLFEDCVELGGESRWFLTSMEPLAYETDGAPELVYCSAYEITDAKRAESLLTARTQQLQLAAETARLGIWHRDMDTGKLHWNDQMFEIYGITREEFAANQLVGLERIHPEDRAGSDQAFINLNAGAAVTLEFRVVIPGGDVRHVYGRGVPVFDANGRLVQLQGISIDVTELKRKEQELSEKEAFLRAVFDNSAHGILVADDNGVYLSASPAAARILGFARETLEGMSLGQLRFLGDHVPDRLLADYLDHGVKEGELELLRPDGKAIVISYKAVRVRKNFNLTMIEDITQKKRMEKRESIASRLEAVGNLAGGIAHDFNNALAAILLQAELLAASDPESTRPAGRIVEAALHARDLVRQIMAFSRQEAMPRKVHDLRETIDEATSLIEQLLPDNVRISIGQSEAPAAALVSPVQMTQVVVNLIVNAVDAMRKTGGELTVSCNFESSPNAAGFIVLCVQDTGPGIPPENLERIFEPFFSTHTRAESSGMGLAVVHGIVSAHGGTIDVQSRPGKGSLFTVRLEASPEASQAAMDSIQTIAAPTGKGQRILLVEDNELVLEVTADILRSLGYQVSPHMDPVRALSEFRSAPGSYSMLLTDQSMPGIRGTDLAEEMRKIRPDIPVLICTGYADSPVESSAYRWLLKPLNRDTLAREAAEILRKSAD